MRNAERSLTGGFRVNCKLHQVSWQLGRFQVDLHCIKLTAIFWRSHQQLFPTRAGISAMIERSHSFGHRQRCTLKRKRTVARSSDDARMRTWRHMCLYWSSTPMTACARHDLGMSSQRTFVRLLLDWTTFFITLCRYTFHLTSGTDEQKSIVQFNLPCQTARIRS